MIRYVEARSLPERDSSSIWHTHKTIKKPKSEVSSPLVAKKDESAPSTYAASAAPVAHAPPKGRDF